MRNLRTSLGAVALAAILAGCAQPGSPGAAASAGSGTAVAKTAAVQRQALASGLYEVAYSASQKAVFVTSSGGFGPDAAQSKVLRLDPATLAVQAEITLPLRGFGVTLDDQANRLYVGHTVDASVSIIDTATNRVLNTIKLADKVKAKAPDGREVERAPHNFRELVLDKANQRLYMPGLGMDGSALYVVDLQAQKLAKGVPGLPPMATGIALDAEGNRLFVSTLTGQIAVIDTVGLIVHKTFDGGGDQLLNLAFDRATGRLFATDQGLPMIQERRKKVDPGYQPRAGNRVIVLDADSGKVLASLPTGEGPVALKLDGPRQRLYVTNRGSGSVSVFDSATYQVLQTLALPAHPNSLALDERGNVLYVSVKNDRDAPKESQESVARISF